jgi:NAD(P)-dependent dehydrogenase (short-subunit alcohol dehydrogenase family)
MESGMTETAVKTASRPDERCVWITGGGSGIGRSLALALASRGRRVVISGRNQARLEGVAAEASGTGIIPITLDVTEASALTRRVSEIEARAGPIEMAFLNAGDYSPMSLDDFDGALFQHLIEVNYLGVVNCLQALLPVMLPRHTGQILISGSLSGYRGLPGAAPYGASKAALINMAESLRPELLRQGIRLRLINPGFVRSELTDKNDFHMPFLIDPEQAAREILKRLPKDGFEITFPTPFALIMKLMRCLPYRLYFRFMQRLIQ